jgi:pyridoxamine 5'-phosphate oxidase
MTTPKRTEYSQGHLSEADLEASPIDQLRNWFDSAEASGIPEWNAMCVSTVSPSGQPSARMVLMKRLNAEGIEFATNYLSQKGNDLAHNDAIAATFWWPTLERQVRIEGRASFCDPAESDELFHERPRESQVVSSASPQSQVIASPQAVKAKADEIAAQFPGEVPRPKHWGGYLIMPSRVEFWQGRPARLHDRLVYVRDGSVWRVERLAP